MAKQEQSPEDIAGQFSPEEMQQIQHFGKALGGGETPFGEEVQDHLDALYRLKPPGEAGRKKEEAALSGGASEEGLAPSDIEQAQTRSGPAIAQKQAQQSAQAAAQAQAQSQGPNAPPAPSGPVGATEPFAAQRGEQPQPQTEDVEPEVPGVQGPASQAGQPPAAPGQEQS